MRGKFSWKIIAPLMALLLLLPLLPLVRVDAASQATRDRLRDLQLQQEQARQDVREQQNLLEGTYAEMYGVMAQMQALDQQMADALAVLEAVDVSTLETEVRIADTMADLAAAHADLDLQNEVFRARLRAMYEAGPIGHVAILLQAENFLDFFMRLEYVAAIYNADRNRLARMQDAENRVSSTLEQLSREYNILGELHRRETAAYDEFRRLYAEREIWFNELAADAEQLEALVAILEAEAHAINVEFGLAQTQYRAEVAEADRRRRDELRRQQEAARAAELAEINWDGQFAWPIPARPPIAANISSPFGSRTSPITGRTEHHSGVDVPAPAGTRINAAADGIVRLAGWSGG
ncbi:MAG: hypothetical protein FWB91_06965, partial [Defluviitaleaceae bacterium]|nr:hypothetical protein [Defluviitaleaceae bacterium]